MRLLLFRAPIIIMCFNEPTSWTTFFIGSVTCGFTLMKFREMQLDSDYSSLVWYWQFTLLMQLAEALLYRWKNTQHQKAFVELAMWLNISQPLIGTALFFPTMSNNNRILSATITGIYVVYCAFTAYKFNKDVFRKNCSNIGLVWWEDKFATILYFLSSFVFQLCISNRDVRYMSLGIL